MTKEKEWRWLSLFGESAEGDARDLSAPTPQTTTGEICESTPAAEGEDTARAREREFRAMMEGEYKDLFTGYFQETFNRRFREQKVMKEDLQRARETLAVAAEYFGVTEGELADVIRAENERKKASAEAMPADTEQEMRQRFDEELQRAVSEAEERARAEAEERVLANIRARGRRPDEAALSTDGGHALSGGVSALSRAQRAEVARRAAKGEQIKF